MPSLSKVSNLCLNSSKILYCNIDNWFCGRLLSWSKRVTCMVL